MILLWRSRWELIYFTCSHRHCVTNNRAFHTGTTVICPWRAKLITYLLLNIIYSFSMSLLLDSHGGGNGSKKGFARVVISEDAGWTAGEDQKRASWPASCSWREIGIKEKNAKIFKSCFCPVDYCLTEAVSVFGYLGLWTPLLTNASVN